MNFKLQYFRSIDRSSILYLWNGCCYVTMFRFYILTAKRLFYQKYYDSAANGLLTKWYYDDLGLCAVGSNPGDGNLVVHCLATTAVRERLFLTQQASFCHVRCVIRLVWKMTESKNVVLSIYMYMATLKYKRMITNHWTAIVLDAQ